MTYFLTLFTATYPQMLYCIYILYIYCICLFTSRQTGNVRTVIIPVVYLNEVRITHTQTDARTHAP